ncbi:nuclear transport factor 2 family protein [Sphingomonas sp. C8-2]|nr:nuclear transport factor 2 family protein [Sphingomonas sp. C8-2]
MSQDFAGLALAMEDRRFRAMAASDIAELNAVLADDLHYTHANGMVEDRAEFIRKITSGERSYRKVTLVGRTVSPQPGFTAIFGQVDVEVMRTAGLLLNRLDYTAIYRDADPRLFAWSAVKAQA